MGLCKRNHDWNTEHSGTQRAREKGNSRSIHERKENQNTFTARDTY